MTYEIIDQDDDNETFSIAKHEALLIMSGEPRTNRHVYIITPEHEDWTHVYEDGSTLKTKFVRNFPLEVELDTGLSSIIVKAVLYVGRLPYQVNIKGS